MSGRRTAGWCVRTNPFVLTPVYKEAARGCVVNLSTTQLQQRRGHKRVLSFSSVLSPCLFYKLTLEGAIVAHSALTLRSLDREENTKLGDGMETKHLEDQNCTFLSVRKKTDKIFVNIKFLVYFMFCFFVFVLEWMNDMLILWWQKTTGAVCNEKKKMDIWGFKWVHPYHRSVLSLFFQHLFDFCHNVDRYHVTIL